MQAKYKLIYNPHAGKKRKLISRKNDMYSLEYVKSRLAKYQIDVDLFPTKRAGHATELARDSIKEGYKTVLVAGGDGTISEVASGLVGSDTTLGIIPMGSFMNTARMLAIPTDIETAIALLKINRVRKIDIAVITKMSGGKLSDPFYFLETAGIGMDAQLNRQFLMLERGEFSNLWSMFKTMYSFYAKRIEIDADDEVMNIRSTYVTVSNGPFTGAALNVAPEAKLNDHRLTISLYKMNNIETILYILNMHRFLRNKESKIKTFTAKVVKICTKNREMPVHADARVFGTTPVEIKIIPNALNVICGFPEPDGEVSLLKRGYLDP